MNINQQCLSFFIDTYTINQNLKENFIIKLLNISKLKKYLALFNGANINIINQDLGKNYIIKLLNASILKK